MPKSRGRTFQKVADLSPSFRGVLEARCRKLAIKIVRAFRPDMFVSLIIKFTTHIRLLVPEHQVMVMFVGNVAVW